MTLRVANVTHCASTHLAYRACSADNLHMKPGENLKHYLIFHSFSLLSLLSYITCPNTELWVVVGGLASNCSKKNFRQVHGGRKAIKIVNENSPRGKGRGGWQIPKSVRTVQTCKLLPPPNPLTPPGSSIFLFHTAMCSSTQWYKTQFGTNGTKCVICCFQRGQWQFVAHTMNVVVAFAFEPI